MSQHIKDTLSQFFKQEDNWRLELLHNWPQIMGHLASKVRLEKIQDDTLILGVFEPSWLQELYLLTPLLISTINKSLPAPYIKNLRFRAAAQTKKAAAPPIPVPPKPKKIVPLRPQEQAALERIEDPQLRSILHEFLIRCRE